MVRERTAMVLAGLLVTGCSTAGWTEQDWASYHQGMNQLGQNGAVASQQMLNTSMGALNQNQVGSLNSTSYQPIQTKEGTWVYCIRTSSYTVSCRTN